MVRIYELEPGALENALRIILERRRKSPSGRGERCKVGAVVAREGMAPNPERYYNRPRMMTEYVHMAMAGATTEELEDGTVYAELPGFRGVWADRETAHEALEELREVLQEWVEFRLLWDLEIPKVGGIDVKQLV